MQTRYWYLVLLLATADTAMADFYEARLRWSSPSIHQLPGGSRLRRGSVGRLDQGCGAGHEDRLYLPGRPALLVSGDGRCVEDFVISPDDSVIGLVGYEEIGPPGEPAGPVLSWMIDARSGELIGGPLPAHGPDFLGTYTPDGDFSPDGNWWVTTHTHPDRPDHYAVWDWREHVVVAWIPVPPSVRADAGNPVQFVSQGDRPPAVLAVGEDGTAHLWDLAPIETEAERGSD